MPFAQGWSALKFRWYNYVSFYQGYVLSDIMWIPNLSTDHNGNSIINSSNYKSLINDNLAIQPGSVNIL